MKFDIKLLEQQGAVVQQDDSGELAPTTADYLAAIRDALCEQIAMTTAAAVEDEHEEPLAYHFNIARDENGLIKGITASPMKGES